MRVCFSVIWDVSYRGEVRCLGLGDITQCRGMISSIRRARGWHGNRCQHRRGRIVVCCGQKSALSDQITTYILILQECIPCLTRTAFAMRGTPLCVQGLTTFHRSGKGFFQRLQNMRLLCVTWALFSCRIYWNFRPPLSVDSVALHEHDQSRLKRTRMTRSGYSFR
jgi:hypothetical protein